MEVGGEGDYNLYLYIYNISITTLSLIATTRMIPALRWAAMRTILMFQ